MINVLWGKIKSYWQLIAAAAIGLLYLSWKSRGQEVESLKTSNEAATASGEIKELKVTQDVQQKQFNESDTSYESMLHDDAELARKLGIGSGQN